MSEWMRESASAQGSKTGSKELDVHDDVSKPETRWPI